MNRVPGWLAAMGVLAAMAAQAGPEHICPSLSGTAYSDYRWPGSG